MFAIVIRRSKILASAAESIPLTSARQIMVNEFEVELSGFMSSI